MIGRRRTLDTNTEEADIRGFDAYDLRLGDLMRGERATLGKSLLDVERELRIRANYVAAIENADPSVFDTPGFIPGYVRSYARYLGMNPDRAFAAFCTESGFSIAHGMSEQASSRYRPAAPRKEPKSRPAAGDSLSGIGTPFAPARESVLSRIEPGAIGSALVLVALIGAIGYGGWSVLRQVQQVRLSPVENTPLVLAELDPLDQAVDTDAAPSGFEAPREDRLTRLYRPSPLEVPVMVARDAPISMLDPSKVGTLSPAPPEADRDSAIERALLAAQQTTDDAPAVVPKVVEGAPDKVQVVAVRPAWVRVRAADGSVIYEGIMNAGDTYEVPGTEEPPTIRVGESGAVYFAVNGDHYGPAGPRGAVTANLALAPNALTERYALADPDSDNDLMRVVAELPQEPQQ
ncbi:helix-turn-helix domain-containing protein [Roseovarius nitratireducens]|uniref:helix-turn-helix domain-containing protein n=1 Tax=Roseovarius nitratireducens TaxID=2044597 RepID=UPI000CE1C113|nr:RodZ domain-containing protein [Roseovarius nitratireducens]